MVFRKKVDEHTVQEVADILGIDAVRVREYIRRGELKAQKRGKSWYVRKDHLQEFIDQNTEQNY